MDDEILASEKRRLQRQISSFFQRRKIWGNPLINAFRSKGWKAVLFGGVPRGVHRSPVYSPRDIDLVLEDESFSQFADVFSGYVTRKTRFGGLHLEWGDIEIDAWPLSSTWAFREGCISDRSFQGLVKTTFFNADALAVDLVPQPRGGRLIYEHGYFSAWRERVLDINLEDNPFPELCVVRGIRLADTYGFAFSPQFVWYLIKCLNSLPLEKFEAIQQAHYESIFYPSDLLVSLLKHLEQHVQNTPLLSFSPFLLGLDDRILRRKRLNKRAYFDPF